MRITAILLSLFVSSLSLHGHGLGNAAADHNHDVANGVELGHNGLRYRVDL